MSETDFVAALDEPWIITGGEFPNRGNSVERMRFLLGYAVLAPSSHNSQPWLFNIHNETIELYADRTRALPVIDPDDRELTISCGAALYHLRLAMRYFGYTDVVEYFPSANNSELLARVTLGAPHIPTSEESKLFNAVLLRRTNRMRYFDRAVPEELLAHLERSADCEGAWLQIVRDAPWRNALGDLIAEGDRLQWSDSHFRRELASWMHPNRSMSADGMPGYARGFGDLISVAAPVAMRTFDMGNGEAAKNRQLVAGSPVLAVLGTEADMPIDWVRSGEALARVLLYAASEGVSASFLNQPCEVDGLRPIVSRAVNRQGYAQLILRMGYGPEVKLTPRRSLGEVII